MGHALFLYFGEHSEVPMNWIAARSLSGPGNIMKQDSAELLARPGCMSHQILTKMHLHLR